MSGIWRDIVDSVKGTEQDYTTGKISRAILLLAIPMVLEMVMESLFALVDIYFVSSLGADAIASVGLTESVMSIVYSIGMGLGMAATGLVSRRIGEKKSDKASWSGAQTMMIGLLVSIGEKYKPIKQKERIARDLVLTIQPSWNSIDLMAASTSSSLAGSKGKR